MSKHNPLPNFAALAQRQPDLDVFNVPLNALVNAQQTNNTNNLNRFTFVAPTNTITPMSTVLQSGLDRFNARHAPFHQLNTLHNQIVAQIIQHAVQTKLQNRCIDNTAHFVTNMKIGIYNYEAVLLWLYPLRQLGSVRTTTRKTIVRGTRTNAHTLNLSFSKNRRNQQFPSLVHTDWHTWRYRKEGETEDRYIDIRRFSIHFNFLTEELFVSAKYKVWAHDELFGNRQTL
jgi:hypothetical protein